MFRTNVEAVICCNKPLLQRANMSAAELPQGCRGWLVTTGSLVQICELTGGTAGMYVSVGMRKSPLLAAVEKSWRKALNLC